MILNPFPSLDMMEMEVGYVANSVDTVVVGTHSAGYLNASDSEKDIATIRFITREFAIAEL